MCFGATNDKYLGSLDYLRFTQKKKEQTDSTTAKIYKEGRHGRTVPKTIPVCVDQRPKRKQPYLSAWKRLLSAIHFPSRKPFFSASLTRYAFQQFLRLVPCIVFSCTTDNVYFSTQNEESCRIWFCGELILLKLYSSIVLRSVKKQPLTNYWVSILMAPFMSQNTVMGTWVLSPKQSVW